MKEPINNSPYKNFCNDQEAIERIFNHIDNGTTDLGDEVWR